MKKNFLLLLLFSITLCANAQSLSPSVVATSGSYYSIGGYSLSYTLGEVATMTYSTGSNILTQGFQQPWKPYSINGQLTYSNAGSSPMMASQVLLKTLAGSTVSTASTNSGGMFYLYDVPAGTYKFDGQTAMNVGSINAADALLTMKHFAHLSTLSGLFLKAADVNLSGNVNSLDALLISKFFTLSIPSLPSGPWLFSRDTVTLVTAPMPHNLKAICYGDVNGSYIPSMKSSSYVQVQKKGELHPEKDSDIEIPVSLSEACQLGSFSLVLSPASDKVTLEGIRFNSTEGTLDWKITDNILRLAWFSETSINIVQSEPLFYLKVSLKNNPDNIFEATDFYAGAETELTDKDAVAFQGIDLVIPDVKVETVFPELFLSEGIPNPAKDNIRFNLGLPEDAQISIIVTNIVGQVIESNDLGIQGKGNHQLNFFTGNLSPGTYCYVVSLNEPSKSVRLTKRFVVVR